MNYLNNNKMNLTTSNNITSGTCTLSTLGTITAGTTTGTSYIDYNTSPNYLTSIGNLTISSYNQNQIMQNKVAVFKVTRNEENKIVSTEFIKEMWIETKNNESIDFIVARDKDLAKYKAEDLSIRTMTTVTFNYGNI